MGPTLLKALLLGMQTYERDALKVVPAHCLFLGRYPSTAWSH